MRRALYFAALLGLVAFGIARCWPSSKQESKQPLEPSGDGTQPVRFPSPSPPAIAAPSIDAGGVSTVRDSMLQQIRTALQVDPQLAESLAREDQKRSPNSPNADERDALLVMALFKQRKFDDARREGIYYFKQYPQGRYYDELLRLLGGRRVPPRSDR